MTNSIKLPTCVCAVQHKKIKSNHIFVNYLAML